MGTRPKPPLSNEPDSGQIADSAVAMWVSTAAALSPIFGQSAFEAFYKRSLHLAVADYPWLAKAKERTVQAGGSYALHVVLSRQSGVCAFAAHQTMAQIFDRLLGDVIGRSVMDRLLRKPHRADES